MSIGFGNVGVTRTKTKPVYNESKKGEQWI
jgi:hypothetical protein